MTVTLTAIVERAVLDDVDTRRLGCTMRVGELVDSFRAACRTYGALTRLPAWRRLERRRLKADLARQCARADRRRLELGGRPDAPGLLDELIAADVILNGPRALTRRRPG